MTRLGTYTTFDCPTKKEAEAFEYLQGKFEAIGGIVRKVDNPHDFGMYLSFEVDYPTELEYVLEDDEDQELVNQKDEWHDKANKIYTEYSKKFEDYL